MIAAVAGAEVEKLAEENVMSCEDKGGNSMLTLSIHVHGRGLLSEKPQLAALAFCTVLTNNQLPLLLLLQSVPSKLLSRRLM